MVIALNCLMVARARLMFAEFLTWLALPALSSAPHLVGNHFSVIGASLTGPFRVWAVADVAAKPKASAPAITVSLFIRDSPPSCRLLFWSDYAVVLMLSVGIRYPHRRATHAH